MAMAGGGGSDYERAICDSFGYALEFLGAGEELRGAHCGTRFAKGNFVRVHGSQVGESEIAHSASGRAEIERIARRHQHHAKIGEISRSSQAPRFYAAGRDWAAATEDRLEETSDTARQPATSGAKAC